MSRQRKTSPKVAKVASKALRSKSSSRTTKTLAGSSLSQAAPKSKKQK